MEFLIEFLVRFGVVLLVFFALAVVARLIFLERKNDDLSEKLKYRITGEYSDDDLEIRDTRAREIRETRRNKKRGKRI